MAEIPAEVLARIDQAFAGAQGGLQDMIADAREAVAEHGPAKAAALLSVMHVELSRENPYVLGTKVIPPAGRRYLDRSRYRRGMAVPGGVLVRAFASVGWLWGGRWSRSPDWQHFSSSGG